MITFASLLWIDAGNHSAVNNKNKKITSYFRQASLLAATLRARMGHELILFSNDTAQINEWFLAHGKKPPRLEPVSSSLTLPAGLSFYSAHHKLDALKAGLGFLASDEDRFILLDTDILMQRKLDEAQLRLLLQSDLALYDISDQVFPAYGAGRIKDDTELVAGEAFDAPRWYGGEFIAASRAGLTALLAKIDVVLPRYLDNTGRLHHVGDEMFVTAALNSLIKEQSSLRITETSPAFIVSRHWSRHARPPLNWHLRHSLVHCPGSKPALEFLSFFDNPSPVFTGFLLAIYQKAVLVYQRLKKIAAAVRPQPKRVSP